MKLDPLQKRQICCLTPKESFVNKSWFINITRDECCFLSNIFFMSERCRGKNLWKETPSVFIWPHKSPISPTNVDLRIFKLNLSSCTGSVFVLFYLKAQKEKQKLEGTNQAARVLTHINLQYRQKQINCTGFTQRAFPTIPSYVLVLLLLDFIRLSSFIIESFITIYNYNLEKGLQMQA